MGNLGQRIREARLTQNLTLREVARRANLTASLISQIERGLANPSVSSLYCIANVLGLPMDYFFEPVARPASVTPGRGESGGSTAPVAASQPQSATCEVTPVVHPAQRDTVDIAGGVQWNRLTPKHDQSIEFIELRYEVGASSGDVAYRHRGREYGIILEGSMLVELGFNKYTLEPGDSISFDCSAPHRLVNVGTTPVVGIWVILDRY